MGGGVHRGEGDLPSLDFEHCPQLQCPEDIRRIDSLDGLDAMPGQHGESELVGARLQDLMRIDREHLGAKHRGSGRTRELLQRDDVRAGAGGRASRRVMSWSLRSKFKFALATAIATPARSRAARAGALGEWFNQASTMTTAGTKGAGACPAARARRRSIRARGRPIASAKPGRRPRPDMSGRTVSASRAGMP